MDLKPALQIQTTIKAMVDVVLPAIDPNNKIAQEQARLVVGMLNLLAERQPLTYRYDRDELSRFLSLAHTLHSQAEDVAGTEEARHALAASIDAGADVLDRARAEPSELESANFDLRERIGALITAMYAAADEAKLRHVSATALGHAREQSLRERSWLIGQGWEQDPEAIPAIEALIGAGARKAGTRAIDKSRPSRQWIENLRRRFPCEREIDRVLTRKLERRAGPEYSPVGLETLCQGIEALLRSQLEDPFEILDPRWQTGGASKVQVEFTLRWTQPGAGRATTPMVLRMEPSESIVETSRRREFQLLKAFQGVVPVPPVFWLDAEGRFLPYPAMIYGFVRGGTKPSTGSSGPSGVGIRFDPVARPILGRRFVQHLAAIHVFDWHGADLSAFDVPQPGTQAPEWQLNWWERVWEEDCNEDVPLMRLAASWLRAHLPPADRITVVHGDYRTGNFLYTEDDHRITAILDWELGHLGDRHEDLAWTLKPSWGHLAEDGPTFLANGLMPENQFLDSYQAASGLSVDRRKLAFYRVFNAYKNVVIVLASSYRVPRGGKGHQDVMLAWLVGLGTIMLDDLRGLLQDLT